MTTDPAALRLAWAPTGGVATAEQWWSVGPPPVSALGDVLRVGAATAVNATGDGADVRWHDDGWPASTPGRPLLLRVRPGELRIGVPPVWRAHAYFGWRDGVLLVASDLRVLVAVLPDARPDPAGVAAFLAGGRATLGVVPSLYAGVREVQPGHEVVVDGAGRVRWRRIWCPELEPGFAATSPDAVGARLRGHVADVTGRLLDGPDRVACLFSGGLDSTLVAGALLRHAPERVALFNVGSGLGTAAEEALRSRFLHAAGAVTHPVDLPAAAGLVRSLRATNAVAPLPSASLFAHVFEEIIAVADTLGCGGIVTGDGGDEAFAEREELLVDLLASRSRALPAAVGRFALRNGEHSARTLHRARRWLRALRSGTTPAPAPDSADDLLGPGLTERVAAARSAVAARTAELWHEGWTWSGIAAYRRTAEVPEWEPRSADRPSFAVASPLADVALLEDALALRRDTVLAHGPGAQPKWLLRQAALEWLAPAVALHPKIGSADGQILAHMRTAELPHLLDLFTSKTARDLGLAAPAAVTTPTALLWQGDGWARAAALVAWFDEPVPRPPARPTVVVRAAPTRTPEPPPADPPVRRATPLRVAALVALDLVAQLVPPRRGAPATPCGPPREAVDDARSKAWTDLARRAVSVPVTSAEPAVLVRALAWYLRLTGLQPTVVRGVPQGRPGEHWWLELDGSAVDVFGVETPLVPNGRL